MWNETTRQFVLNHRHDNVQKLALQKHNTADLDIPWALTQIEGRQHVEKKIPSWYQVDDIVYPPHLALEQCSSEQTARYKAGLLSGTSFVDLTGGFGVDFAFLSGSFRETYYVEKQIKLCEIAAFNFTVLDMASARVVRSDACRYLKKMQPVDTIYIDPGRRSASGKKVFIIEELEPDLLKMQDLLLEKAEKILIKLSPVLDITKALRQLKHVAEIHVVSLENECKELLFLLTKNSGSEPLITCVNLTKNKQPEISFLPSQERAKQVDYTSEIERYIYEPNVSLLKAGFFKSLTDLYPIRKFHSDSHLYTSAQFIPDFPGRVFQTEAYSSMNKAELKTFLHGIDRASITTRNFPLTVAKLRSKINVKEGGKTYIFATTLANGRLVLINSRKLV
jgi:16S rRNA G966 N2-methylase RsmD